MPSPLIIAGRAFQSRLLVGTGKFPSNESMRDALAASGTEIAASIVSGDSVRPPGGGDAAQP